VESGWNADSCGERTEKTGKFADLVPGILVDMATPHSSAIQSPAILKSDQNFARSGHSRSYQAFLWSYVVAILAIHVFFLWAVRDRIAKGDPDFTVFYTAGKILREGRGSQLYDPATQQAVQREFANDSDIRRGPLPYIHPPFEALFFLPLTFFSYRTAFIAWDVLNLAMLAGILAMLSRSLGSLRRFPLWQWLAVALAFFPVLANLHQGQDAILLLLVVVLAFRALDRGALFLAGCWLGFGVLKYHLILPLALIFAIWRGKKFLLGFATVAASVVLISLALVGWNGAMAYPVYAWRIVSEPAFGGIPARQLPNLEGLLAGLSFPESFGWPLHVAVLVGSAALLVMVASLKRFTTDSGLFRMCIACAVVVAPFVGYSTNSYDLVLLILPLVLVAEYCLQNPRETSFLRWKLFLPILPVLISPFWFFLWMRWERISLMAVFLLWWAYAMAREVVRRSQPGTDLLETLTA
jgi:hypothetical protein